MLKAIKTSDIEELKKFRGKYDICDLYSAINYGSFDSVKFFIEEMKMTPVTIHVELAFNMGHSEIFAYFVDNFNHLLNCNTINFNLCKGNDLDAKVFEDKFKTISQDEQLNVRVKLMVAIYQSVNYTLTSNNLRNILSHNITSLELQFILENVITSSEMELYVIALLYKLSDLNLSLPCISKLSPHLTSSMTNKLIDHIILDRTKQVQCILNIIRHIDMHGIIFNEDFPFFEFNIILDNFKSLFDLLPITLPILIAWIEKSISNRELDYMDILSTKVDLINQIPLDIQRHFIKTAILDNRGPSKTIIDTLIHIFPFLINEKWLQWIDIIKEHGFENANFAQDIIQEEISTLLPAINFDFELPEKKERWCWWRPRFPDENGATYVCDTYEHDLEIDPQFKDIKTLNDIKDNLEYLNETFNSVTDCYFNVRDNGVFYVDSQDCLIWAIEFQTGYVYIYDPDDIFQTTYVAHSIPEFLTRIQQHNVMFSESHSVIYMYL